jgi:exopolyphosphatase/guanosine-5'-triphosphate,3'-diphosphate pyrophosphatase
MSKMQKSKPKLIESPAVVSEKLPLFAALDLGTNSCRMLIARPRKSDFEVIDAFSKTVYLGKGMDSSGKLSNSAMKRTISALHVCQKKLISNEVKYTRLVATAACRQALNGREFIKRARKESNLKLEIINPSEEARLAVIGSVGHLKPMTEQVLVVDIGGGSTELVWLDLTNVEAKNRKNSIMMMQSNQLRKKELDKLTGVKVVDWISVPFGVTNLKEQYSDVEEDKAAYAMMSWYFEEYITHFGPSHSNELKILPNFQIIGTSGTITTIAATKLGLLKYDRQKVDGYEMTSAQVGVEIDRYLTGGPDWRAKNPCIGDSRKDFIMSGAAILRSILRVWPTNTLTVADRGLREGILYSQMVKQGYLR